jgi:hypothetical protein
MSAIITLDRKILRPYTFRDPEDETQSREDEELVRQDKLTVNDFFAARHPRTDKRGHLMNPVRVEHRDRHGLLKKVRYSHNLRTNDGADWQAHAMGGGPNSSTLAAVGFQQNTKTNIAITAPVAGTSAGKVTDTTANINAATGALNQWIGSTLLYADSTTIKAAHIVGNSASASSSIIWYFDNWFLATDWSTAVAAPAANMAYFVIYGSPTLYLGLSLDATAPNAADHIVASEIVDANGLKRAFAMAANEWAHTASGTSYQMKNLFTATGSYTAVQKCGMFTGFSFPNDAAADLTNVGKGGGVLVFENTFTSVNLISGDTLTVTWTVNY